MYGRSNQRRPRTTTATNRHLSFLPPNTNTLGRFGSNNSNSNTNLHSQQPTPNNRQRLPPAQLFRGTNTRRNYNNHGHIEKCVQRQRRVHTSQSSRSQQQQLKQQRQRWQERKNTFGGPRNGSRQQQQHQHLQHFGQRNSQQKNAQQQGQQQQQHGQQRSASQNAMQRRSQYSQQHSQQQRNTLRRSRSAAGNRQAAPVRVAQPLLGANNQIKNKSRQHNQQQMKQNRNSKNAAQQQQQQHQQQHQQQQQQQPMDDQSNGMLQCTTGTFVGSHGHACGAVSAAGLKPNKPGWKNQDSFLLMEKFTHTGKESVSLLGVFDGHGPEGGGVSAFCRDNVSWVLQDCSVQPPFGPATAPLISNSFLRLDKELRHNIKTAHSGSTGVVVLLSSDVIVVSHVGDSRMCVGQVHRNASDPRASIKVVQLTSDHKPERRDEHLRIRSSGGRVGPSSSAVDPQYATMRVWSAHPQVHGPGLAVSRAFGDAVAHTCGVISVPEVRVRSIQPEDRWFMIGSDGVWDVMSLADVGEVVERVAARNPASWSPQKAASIIVSTARHRWLRTPQAMGRVDDITALVVRIKNAQAR